MAEANWKYFERLVAAIHRAADAGATVQWNESIGGRQFDVTIRFRKGLYDHLTVVECKDYGTPVQVEKVEAFTTKARDAGADLAVLASTSGFQSGAIICAERHKITLINVTDAEIDPTAFGLHFGEPIEVIQIEGMALVYADGQVFILPGQANALEYYAKNILLQRGSRVVALAAYLDRELQGIAITSKCENHALDIPHGTQVVAPADGYIPLKSLKTIRVGVYRAEAVPLKGPYAVDPSVLRPNVNVQNVSTGEESVFKYQYLALGLDNVFSAGHFYEAQGLGYYYYCEKVEDGIATVKLLESYQLGRLLQARLTLEAKYGERYIPVKDSKTLERLRIRLANYPT